MRILLALTFTPRLIVLSKNAEIQDSGFYYKTRFLCLSFSEVIIGESGRMETFVILTFTSLQGKHQNQAIIILEEMC